MLRLLLRLWWLQQRRNFHKRDAFVVLLVKLSQNSVQIPCNSLLIFTGTDIFYQTMGIKLNLFHSSR